MRPKNLIVICADQLRYDALGINGNRVVSTPNIDAIGARGISFDAHHTPNQICSPSRASMATGLYPRNHGLWRNGVALDEHLPSLWQTLREAGYRTHAVGKLHFQPLQAPADMEMPESLAFWERDEARDWSGPYYGFEHVDLVLGEANESTKAGHYADWLKENHPDVVNLYEPDALPHTRTDDLAEVWKSAVPAPLHYTNWIADRARDAIEHHAGNSPFALFVSFPDPHHPFAPPAPYCDLYDPEAMPKPSVREGELERMPAYLHQSDDPRKAAYIGEGEKLREQGFLLRTDAISERTLSIATAHTYGMVQMIDEAVGRILSALESSGMAEDTFVVFTSDHGELLGDHGLLRKGPPPYRQLLQVPLVASGPGIPAASRSNALTSHIDLFATFASLLDVRHPSTDGVSLKSLMLGQTDRVRDHLFAEYHPRQDNALYNLTVISPEWRYTCYPNEPLWGELFDRRNDPWEHWNVYGDDRFSHELERLQAELAANMPPHFQMRNVALGAY